MGPVVFIAASIFSPDGTVTLEDAYRFPIDPGSCRNLWRMSEQQPPLWRAAVTMNNSPEVVAQWEQDVYWRARCWFLLDDVLYCDYPPEKKVESLQRLRDLLGEPAFRAGWMPAPIPQYNLTPK